MLELLEKIRSRKFLFLLLIAPLFFTPIRSYTNSSRYYGLTIGPQLAFPIGDNGFIETIAWDSRLSYVSNQDHPFDWRIGGSPPDSAFVDWGRIVYWECWVLLFYFCIVPWCKTLLKRGLNFAREKKQEFDELP